MTEEFQEHKEILTDLLQNKITTETIIKYLSLLDDFYYNSTGKVYPKWLTRCDHLSLEGAKNSFEVQLIINLADQLLPIIKDKKECFIHQLITKFSHIDSNLVKASIDYLNNQCKIHISGPGMIRYILTLEDRKKLLIDRITSGSKEMICALEDSLEEYKEKLAEEIPF